MNVDLIFAAPGQTMATWMEDLGRILALAPEHVSAYDLAFEEGTQFRRWLDEGRLAKCDEERELELFLATRELLSSAGLGAYEVSNFARPGEECRHNVNYWLNGPYVGVGPSAVSCVSGVRGGNPRSIPAYRRRVAAGGNTWEWSEQLAPRARLGETWWLGLRLAAGVDPEVARATAGFGEVELDPAVEIAERFERDGWLEREGRSFRTSARGLPVADALAREFLELGR